MPTARRGWPPPRWWIANLLLIEVTALVELLVLGLVVDPGGPLSADTLPSMLLTFLLVQSIVAPWAFLAYLLPLALTLPRAAPRRGRAVILAWSPLSLTFLHFAVIADAAPGRRPVLWVTAIVASAAVGALTRLPDAGTDRALSGWAVKGSTPRREGS